MSSRKNRDTEIVNEMRSIFRSLLSSPSIAELPGNWYLFEGNNQQPWIETVGEDGFVGNEGSSLEWYISNGWTVTPLIIHRATATR